LVSISRNCADAGVVTKMKEADAINHQRVNAVETAVRLNLASAMTSPMFANFY